MESNNNKPESFWQRQATTVKGLVIFFLVLILLIPTYMVADLISERQYRQSEAVGEVSEKWGREQTITGPIIAIPYDEPVYDKEEKAIAMHTGYVYFLPETLNIDGDLKPEKRHRGIFEVVLYESQIELSGSFRLPDIQAQIPENASLRPGQARLIVSIPDLRGIENQVALDWMGEQSFFDPGMPYPGISESGINTPVSLPENQVDIPFKITLNLRGSGSFYMTPVGKVTQAKVHSNWPDPSFTGAFLPDDQTISQTGFDANWKVLHLNRNYPQFWNSENTNIQFYSSTFGVDLFLPVDNYQKATRSIKYAILFISLTFLAVFFIELRQEKPVHPFQYGLIGLALVIFYTLLVSISEHIPFNFAYLIAGAMTVGLAGLYARSLFQSGKMGFLVGGTLTCLYGFLFVTLQLQDYALLIGSIGLFAILATVMYVSRKINFQKE
ncbi:MAG: cell envelope integrity protein CreD [Saprospiraceae bacterium]